MKYLFYTFLTLGSLGTIATVTHPALVQQGAALVGWELSLTDTEPAEKLSSEEQLTQFLSQYPFGDKNNNVMDAAAMSPAGMSSVAIPPAAMSPLLFSESSYPEPATSFPVPSPVPSTSAMPISDGQISDSPLATSDAPSHHQPLHNQPFQHHWDGESDSALSPFETGFQSHAVPVDQWSGPAQPFQEPVPAPQTSIYAANISPTSTPPPFSPQPPIQPQTPSSAFPMHSMQKTEAMLIEDIPVLGTEMVAKVGTQVILMGDILPKLRRETKRIIDEQLDGMPEEHRGQVTQQELGKLSNTIKAQLYPSVLQEQILFALIYDDYMFHQNRESRAVFDEKMAAEFDRNVIPELLKEFNVESVASLKTALEGQLGSSLEKERRLWIRENIVKEWIRMSVQKASADCTHEEMMEFYENNLKMFTTTTRARWQELSVLFSSHQAEAEAWSKMRWMGNQTANGASFEEIARTHSDGFTASQGGEWDWTTKGSLVSAELEQAIFSQPIGILSPAIIKTDRGLHIVRVMEREEETVVPFIEAQVTIRERIRQQRSQQNQDDYIEELRRRIPSIVLKERIDFDSGIPRTARGN